MIEPIEIKRFFYPIGHGGFYAEKHKVGKDNFTMVYDCGSKSPKIANTIIEKAFYNKFLEKTKKIRFYNKSSKQLTLIDFNYYWIEFCKKPNKEVIDILFISHFDDDHVNKIDFLNKRTTIKNVVMPLLHEKEIYLLQNMYRVLKLPTLRLLINPEEFFDKNTKIIKIKPVGNEEDIDSRNTIDLDNLNTFIRDSGIHIKKNSLHYEWVFIPYNYEHKERLKQLKEKLLKANFTKEDIIALQKNPEETLEKIEKDIPKSTKDDKTKFKNLYNSIVEINQTSMLLYSGVITLSKDNFLKTSCRFDFSTNKELSCIPKRTNKISCLYTGDINLNQVDIKEKLSDLWKNIGTIQIPHHGSVKDFKKSILNDRNYICPISVSNDKLTGKHPAKSVIDDIISQDSYPVLVTNELDFGLIEYINNDEYKKRVDNLGCLKHLLYLK